MLLLPDMATSQDASLMANQVLKAIAQPIATDEREFDFSGSIGISVFPTDGNDYDTLLRRSIDEPEWFWRAVLEDLDIRFYEPFTQVMDTSAACRTYNVLVTEGRSVAAALIV